MFGSKSAPSKLSLPPHPFYPLELELVGYLANDKDVVTLLTIFLAGCVVLCGTVWVSVSRYSAQLRKIDKCILIWFVLSMSTICHPSVLSTRSKLTQPGRFTFSSKDTSPSIILAWHQPVIFSANSGRSMPSPIQDISHPIRSSCAWRPSQQSVFPPGQAIDHFTSYEHMADTRHSSAGALFHITSHTKLLHNTLSAFLSNPSCL